MVITSMARRREDTAILAGSYVGMPSTLVAPESKTSWELSNGMTEAEMRASATEKGSLESAKAEAEDAGETNHYCCNEGKS